MSPAEQISLSSLPNYSSASSSRLHSLYSDFASQKASNPVAFDSKIAWWREVLPTLVARGWQPDTRDRLILHGRSSLVEAWKYEGCGKPLGLPVVIAELRASGELISFDEFMDAKTSIYDQGSIPYRLASYVIKKPLVWALQQLSVIDSDENAYSSGSSSLWRKFSDEYVVVKNIERAADSLEQELRSRQRSGTVSETLFTVDSLKEMFGSQSTGTSFAEKLQLDVPLSNSDIAVLLKYLSRDRKMLTVEDGMVKFVGPDADAPAYQITAVDRGILELKAALNRMEAQVEEIQRRIKERSLKISAALRDNQKDAAMIHLRTRKLLEETVRKRFGSLEVLQSTLIQVETAAGDVEIMKAYESSTATLRTILSHPSLQRNKIDETMDALAEATAEVQDIGQSISAGSSTMIDEDELADELAQLVKEAQEEERKREAERDKAKDETISLPSVPSHEPGDHLDTAANQSSKRTEVSETS